MKRSKEAPHPPGERFIMMPCPLLGDMQWSQLPPAARVIFIDLCKRHNGKNNGAIGYGCRDGARAANISPRWAGRMLDVLMKAGLLRLHRDSSFNVKDRTTQTREWEATIFPMPGRPLAGWRSGGSKTLHLAHWMLTSPSYLALSVNSKCMLIELMRRYDGGNNGRISFGGKHGAYAGLGPDATDRALAELHQSGFIVETARALPHLGQPRKWRLTMYKEEGKSASKDFMRCSASTPENPFHGKLSAAEPGSTVSAMRLSLRPADPNAKPHVEPNANKPSAIGRSVPTPGGRNQFTVNASDSRTQFTHIETIPIGDLFADCLPCSPTPLDRLRRDLHAILPMRRGTQSRLAEALGISRHTFSNALLGRERFSKTVAAALRDWLDGGSMPAGWPPLPKSDDADVA